MHAVEQAIPVLNLGCPRGRRFAFENNRKRDQVLPAAGLRVMRVTDRQLTGEPIAIAARVAQAL